MQTSRQKDQILIGTEFNIEWATCENACLLAWGQRASTTAINVLWTYFARYQWNRRFYTILKTQSTIPDANHDWASSKRPQSRNRNPTYIFFTHLYNIWSIFISGTPNPPSRGSKNVGFWCNGLTMFPTRRTQAMSVMRENFIIRRSSIDRTHQHSTDIHSENPGGINMLEWLHVIVAIRIVLKRVKRMNWCMSAWRA